MINVTAREFKCQIQSTMLRYLCLNIQLSCGYLLFNAIHSAHKLIETSVLFAVTSFSIRYITLAHIGDNEQKNYALHFGSYDDSRHINWLSIKTLVMLKINVKALAKCWFASAMPARISSRFFSRHCEVRKKHENQSNDKG